MSAFDSAMAALLADPHLGVDALYRVGGTGNPVALRVLRTSPDRIASGFDTEMDFSPTGPATATIKVIAQGSARGATSSGGTPTTAAYTAFHKAQGSIRAVVRRLRR